MGIEFSERGSRLFFCSIFILSAIMAGVGANQYRINKYIGRAVMTISFCILFLPLGMRTVGIDHEVYREWYDNSDLWLKANYHLTPEPLFAALTIIAKDVFGEFQIIYLISAFVYLVGVFVFLKKSESFGYVSILFMSISLYLYMCGLARMSISIGLVSYACSTLDKKYKPLIMIFVACLFHYTAIITVLVYTTYRSKKNVSFRNIIYIVVGVLFLSIIINRYSAMLPYAIMRYAGYIRPTFNVGNITGVIILIPSFVLWIMFNRGYKNIYEGKYTFYNSVMKIIFGLVCLSMVFDGVFRITFYFYPLIAKVYFDFSKVLNRSQQGLIVPIYSGVFTIVGLAYIYNVFFDSPFITHMIIPFAM